MNINPFVYSYKRYPKSILATMVNQFCSAMQRIFFFFALLIVGFVIIGDVSNWGVALCGAAIFFLLWFLFKFNKEKWSDKIASKQEEVDNSDGEEIK